MLTFRQYLTESTSLKQALFALRPEMAEAAQAVYNAWNPDEEDDEYCGGGICDAVAEAIAGAIDIPGVNITEGGHDGDDHAWNIAYDAKDAYGIDIPASVYERGGGYNWAKVPGVRIEAGDVEIFKVERRLVLGEEVIKGPDGKPKRFYHGTTRDFGEFKPGKYKRGMQLGFGIHFTGDPEFASHYTGHQTTDKEGPKKGGNVRPAFLDVKKALDTTQIYGVNDPEYAFAQALYKGTGRKLPVSDGKFMIFLDHTAPQRAERLLKQFGYDAVLYNAVIGRRTWSPSGGSGFMKDKQAESNVVLSPSQIKPAFGPPE